MLLRPAASCVGGSLPPPWLSDSDGLPRRRRGAPRGSSPPPPEEQSLRRGRSAPAGSPSVGFVPRRFCWAIIIALCPTKGSRLLPPRQSGVYSFSFFGPSRLVLGQAPKYIFIFDTYCDVACVNPKEVCVCALVNQSSASEVRDLAARSPLACAAAAAAGSEASASVGGGSHGGARPHDSRKSRL
jgi:hypothetical protein